MPEWNKWQYISQFISTNFNECPPVLFQSRNASERRSATFILDKRHCGNSVLFSRNASERRSGTFFTRRTAFPLTNNYYNSKYVREVLVLRRSAEFHLNASHFIGKHVGHMIHYDTFYETEKKRNSVFEPNNI